MQCVNRSLSSLARVSYSLLPEKCPSRAAFLEPVFWKRGRDRSQFPDMGPSVACLQESAGLVTVLPQSAVQHMDRPPRRARYIVALYLGGLVVPLLPV